MYEFQLIPLSIATKLIKDGCELTAEQITDLHQRYSADELTPELAAYLNASSEVRSCRRRGRPRARKPAIEFHRRTAAVADYHLFIYEEQQWDAQGPSRVRRNDRSAEETPRERALKRVKEKHGFVPSPRRIENLLCEWWKDSTVRRCALRKIRREIECRAR